MNPLLKEILTSTWLIHNERKDAYAAILFSLLKGESLCADDLSEQREQNRAYVVNRSGALVGSKQRISIRADKIPAGSIAVITIRDEIFKYDQACGPRGTQSILEDIKVVEANSNIKSILLVIDSPGGQVSFTDVLADAIKNSTKPVIGYVEGMAASAAYWIVSGCNRIIASSKLDRVGAIGTMLFFADLQPAYEEMGVVFHEFYATQSIDKNQDLNDVLDGKYDAYRKNTLDVINKQFLAGVTANRPNLDPSTLTGKIYFAPDAISLGLIDEIGTLEYALEQADLADQSSADEIPEVDPNNPNANTNSEDMLKITFKGALTSLKTLFAEATEETELTTDMVRMINDKLAELQTKVTELEGEKAARIQKEEEFATLQTKFDQLQADYTKLKGEDAGKETGAAKEADRIQSEPVRADNFVHNKIADKVFPPKSKS